MPPVVVAGALAVAGSVATAAITGGLAALSLMSLATTFAVAAAGSFLQSALSRPPSAPELPSFAAEAQGRMVISRSSVPVREIVYGETTKAGPLLFWDSSGDNNRYLHMVIALAAHEIESVETVYFGDEELGALDEDGNVTEGRFEGKARIRFHYGHADQIADPLLVEEVEAVEETDRWRGIAYVYVRLEHDQTIYGGQVPAIKVRIKGKKDIHDPRDDSTGWTDNWALCLLDYARSDDGLRAGADEIDLDAFIAAANAADEQVALKDEGEQARYTVNGVIPLDTTPDRAVGNLELAGAGHLWYQQGRLRLIAGVAAAPTAAVTPDDLRDAIQITPTAERRVLYNSVKGTFQDRSKRHYPTEFPGVSLAAYVEADGGEPVERDLELAFVDDVERAQRIAFLLLAKSRLGLTVDFPAKPTLTHLSVLDVVTLDFPEFGFEDLTVRVVDRNRNPDGSLDFTFQRDFAAIYDWDPNDATIPPPPPPSALPSPWQVSPPTALTVSSGTGQLYTKRDGTVVSRIRVTWTGPADAFVREIEPAYRRTGETGWVPLPAVPAGAGETFVWDVEDGIAYDVQLVSVNALGVRSAAATAIGHVVVGKTAPPPAVQSFTVQRLADGTRRFAWVLDPVPADVRAGGGYRIRFGSGGGVAWGDMAALHTGLLAASPYETNALAAGTYSFGIVAVDSSGNESAAPRIVEAVLGDPRLRDVLLARDEAALGWPGTITDGFVNFEGQLEATGSESWADLPSTWAALADSWRAIVASDSPLVYATPAIDLGAEASWTPLVSADVTGTPTIEMRTGTAADGEPTGAWVALGPVTGKRWVEIRVSVAGDTPAIAALQLLIDAATAVEDYEDVDTSASSAGVFERLGDGHFRLGTRGRHAAISQARITAFQDAGPGWTWSLVDKAATVGGEPAAEFKIWQDGVAADAVIDAEIKGPRA